MSVGRVLVAPWRGGALVRAGVHLVLGGVVAGAYVLLVTAFASMFTMPATPRLPAVVLAVVTAVVVLTPPFLAPVRVLEILAARTFLDAAVPVPAPQSEPSPATRWRAATWYVLHLALGAVVVAGLFVVVPVALQLILAAFGTDAFGQAVWTPWDALDPGAWAVIAAVVLVALPYLAAVEATVLRQAAPALLGPDQAERIAELEARGDRLAERGRLARELHDSVGHALTVTTLQAAAAARTLDRDPDAARRSLAAIEETGRTALADLDHVLGLLRDDGTTRAETPDSRHTPRTLDDVPALVDQVRAGGADVTLVPIGVPIVMPVARATASDDTASDDTGSSPGPAASTVPRAVSREAYRVVQEALTNAVRHAPGVPVTLRVGCEDRDLVIDVSNPLPAGAPDARHPDTGYTRTGYLRAGHPDSRRHGIAGMRERVEALGGRLTAGPDDGMPSPVGTAGPERGTTGAEGGAADTPGWAVRASFPLPRRPRRPHERTR
jgi:signal transduction histidine kinase